MAGIDGRSGFMANRAKRTWLAVVTALMLAFSLMATAAPAGAGGDQDKDIPGQCEPGYTKVVDDYGGGKSWTADADYSSVVLVGGPKDPAHNKDPQGRNVRFDDVKAGDVIARTEHDISHICAIPAPVEPELNSASLTIVKLVRSTEKDVPQTRFPFAIAAAGETESFAVPGGESKTFDFEFDSDRFDVVVGELTGELADGFSFVSASCAIGDRVIPQTSRASVSLFDGADVTCTFLNRYDVPVDAPSVMVVKDVQGDVGAKTTEFDIRVGTRDRNVIIALEDGGSHTFLPLAGTENFGIAEQSIGEDGWTTAISCVSDERDRFGARGPSLVIDEIGVGEDIICTVINTFDAPDVKPPVIVVKDVQIEIDTPCYDDTAENEAGICVKPEPPEAEVEVLGIQIEATTTTVDAVATDTLPFTGDDSNGLVIAGLLVLIAGALLIGGSFFEPALVRGGRHEDSRRSIGRWENN